MTAGTEGQTDPATAGDWGRVAEDGTVYVKLPQGEHAVGQYPEGTPEEALAFFTKRYDALAFEVSLLEQRITAGALSPDEAHASIAKVAAQLDPPHAVGDIRALSGRLDALKPLVAAQKAKRKEERARKVEEARGRKGEIVAEAEKIAAGKDWRNGANRLRDLLGEWKELPRLEKAADDELWKRFSTARTAYTRARKAHFSELDEKRGAAKVVKQRLVAEAEALADSTDWGPTSAKYRSLMQDWKAAGPAPKDVDDKLWKRFRGAQDTFFGARDAANAELDKEFEVNAEKKKALLVEAEALLPIKDLDAAKAAFRDISERWDAAGKVPRDQIKPLEARIRKVEQAIRSLEDEKWAKSDPEKSARADGMVAQLRAGVADLEAALAAAESAGDTKRAKRITEDLSSKRAFLEMAEKAAAEFS